MKVMHIVADFPPLSVGGMEVHVYYLIRELTKLGTQCIIVHGGATEHLINDKGKIQNRSFTSKYFRVRRVLSLNILGKSNCFMPSLPFIIRKEKPDIVHVHGYWNLYTIEIGLMAILSKIPYVLTAHGIGGYWSVSRFKRILMSIHDHIIQRILPHFNKIIAVSSYTKRELEERDCDDKKVVVIPNGVSSTSFNLPSGEAFRKRLDLSSENIILSIGRIDEVKGYQYMIEAMTMIEKKMASVVYLIIGADSGYKSVLESSVRELGLEDHVRFLGFVTEEEKLEALSASSVVVMPSLYEGLSLVLLEVMAAGKPIVATTIGGTLDVVRHNSAILVPPRDSTKLAEAVIKILTNKEVIKKLIFNAKQEVKRFSWSNIAQTTKSLYESIL